MPTGRWPSGGVEGYTVSLTQSGITFVITNTAKTKTPSGSGETPPPEEEEELEEWDTPLGDKELLDPEEEEIPDSDTPLSNLPQTGQLWWPVPILAMGGVLMIFMGLVRRRRWSDADED